MVLKRLLSLLQRYPKTSFVLFNLSLTYIFYYWVITFLRLFISILLSPGQFPLDDYDLEQIIVGGTLCFAIMFWTFTKVYKSLIDWATGILFYNFNIYF